MKLQVWTPDGKQVRDQNREVPEVPEDSEVSEPSEPSESTEFSVLEHKAQRKKKSAPPKELDS